jgi:hypothetical protein
MKLDSERWLKSVRIRAVVLLCAGLLPSTLVGALSGHILLGIMIGFVLGLGGAVITLAAWLFDGERMSDSGLRW